MTLADLINGVFGRNRYQRLDAQPTVPGSFDEEAQVGQPVGSSAQTTVHALTEKLVVWLNVLVLRPLAIVVAILFRVFAKAFNTVMFHDAPELLAYTQLQDPIDKVNKFVRLLEDQLLCDELRELLPPFFEGSYTQALYMATQRARFLFVYLTNEHNQGADQMFRQVIINPAFRLLFRADDPNVILWGGDLTNPEAYQLANSLNVTRFPFVGLLCLTRTLKMTPLGPVKTAPTVSLVAKLQGGIRVGTNAGHVITTKFGGALARYSDELALIRGELREKYMSQVLKRQQDLSYQQLLQQDRLKKLHRERKQAEDQWLRYQAHHRFARDDASGARIAVKFSDGSRKQVVMDGERKVEDLYTYVELVNRGLLGTATLEMSETQFTSKFHNFTMHYGFTLVLAVPPRVLLNEHRDEAISEVPAIYPLGMLMVEQE